MHGNTPLSIAVQAGYEDVIKYLLKKGAGHDIANRYGNTPLYYAIQKDQKSIESLLLSKGAINMSRSVNKDSIAIFKAIVENNHIISNKYFKQ